MPTFLWFRGSEPCTEETVRLVLDTGGVSVLAHPWALKNPIAIIRRLKEAGLHGLEVYRSDGILSGIKQTDSCFILLVLKLRNYRKSLFTPFWDSTAYSDLANTYGLMKLGGSDFHGRGGKSKSELGSVNLPILALHEFLQVGRPIWCRAIRDTLETYANDPSDMNLARVTRFGRVTAPKGGLSAASREEDLINRCLTSWLTVDERQKVEIEAIRSKFSGISTQ